MLGSRILAKGVLFFSHLADCRWPQALILHIDRRGEKTRWMGADGRFVVGLVPKKAADEEKMQVMKYLGKGSRLR